MLVNLHDTALSDCYLYRHSELAKRMRVVYGAYMAKPKKDGSEWKEVGFR